MAMIVGLTGGIGSGKSTIAHALRQRGYAVYDSDTAAKRLIMEDASVRAAITTLLGDEAYADGRYQTAWVASRVFAQPSLLQQLNAIVHPAVVADMQQWLTTANGSPVFVECAILYSSGLASLCDRVVAVTAHEELRIQRTIQRDGTQEEKVRARIRAQHAEQDEARADIVVHNDGKVSIEQLCEDILTKCQ